VTFRSLHNARVYVNLEEKLSSNCSKLYKRFQFSLMDSNNPPKTSRRTDDDEMCPSPSKIPPGLAHDMRDTPQVTELQPVAKGPMGRAISILEQYIEANKRVISLMDEVKTADEPSRAKHVIP